MCPGFQFYGFSRVGPGSLRFRRVSSLGIERGEPSVLALMLGPSGKRPFLRAHGHT